MLAEINSPHQIYNFLYQSAGDTKDKPFLCHTDDIGFSDQQITIRH
jgi:hypothetical protein